VLREAPWHVGKTPSHLGLVDHRSTEEGRRLVARHPLIEADIASDAAQEQRARKWAQPGEAPLEPDAEIDDLSTRRLVYPTAVCLPSSPRGLAEEPAGSGEDSERVQHVAKRACFGGAASVDVTVSTSLPTHPLPPALQPPPRWLHGCACDGLQCERPLRVGVFATGGIARMSLSVLCPKVHRWKVVVRASVGSLSDGHRLSQHRERGVVAFGRVVHDPMRLPW